MKKMSSTPLARLRLGIPLLVAWVASSGFAQAQLAQVRVTDPVIRSDTADSITVVRTNYHGWADSIVIGNGIAEAVIVPAVGRIMQFGFVGQESPFWENSAMFGQKPDPESKEWGNFGGDKTWPAPQADWSKVTPRDWPPPIAFDSMRVDATLDGKTVILVSPVDPHYGIRARRHIQLNAKKPVMTVTTTYEKVKGDPLKVSIWIITQLKEPLGVFVPVPKDSIFPLGYNKQTSDLPPSLKVEQGLISIVRNPKASHKIGNDAGTMLWIGEKVALRIDSPRVPNRDYPDNGSSAEIYTNPDPAAYVELEALGPLETMKPGDKISRINVYTLLKRTEPTPLAEARKILAPE